MNSTEVASTDLTLGGKKLAWARAGLLALAVLTPLFLAANIWSDWVIFSNFFAEGHQILGTFYGIIDLIDTTTIVFSWVLALILLRKKLNDVGQILVMLMFLTRVTSHTFWYLLFMGTTPEVEPGLRTFLVLAMTIPYEFLNVLSLFAVLLTFPTGRFYNRFARWLFWLASAIQVLSLVLSLLIQNGITAFGALDTSSFSLYMGLAIGYMPILIQMLAGFMLFLHYRAMPNSGQRQQIKWIVVFFVLSSCVVAFNAILPFILNPILVWLSTQNLMPWTLELVSKIPLLGKTPKFTREIQRFEAL